MMAEEDVKALEAMIHCSFCGRQKNENEDFITSEKNRTVFICLPCTASAWGVVSQAIANGALIKNPEWKPPVVGEQKEEEKKEDGK